MKKLTLAASLLALTALAGCGKYGAGTALDRLIGNWAPIAPPSGCVVKQIAAEESGGLAVLCEDGRLFH